ncbi:MAG TPA: hypothetical protein VFI91_02370 [Longimicrobiaceae bacterium]|nr:hypothetical protein [Longimicrobiaceae bacterium]
MDRLQTFLAAALLAGLAACGSESPSDWELPDPAVAQEWFGEDARVSLSGNVLELRGTIPAEFLRRGGSIWAESGPYFYIFNVKVQELLEQYPDLAGVRAIAYTEDGEEVARAMLRRDAITGGQFEHGVRLASRAQTEGTESPRRVEDLIQFGEEYTEYEYRER